MALGWWTAVGLGLVLLAGAASSRRVSGTPAVKERAPALAG
jgi:hypothetical protein